MEAALIFLFEIVDVGFIRVISNSHDNFSENSKHFKMESLLDKKKKKKKKKRPGPF